MKKKLKKVFILVNDPIFVYQHLLPIIDKLKYKTSLYIVSSYRKKFKLNFRKVKVINIPIKREPSFFDIYVFHLCQVQVHHLHKGHIFFLRVYSLKTL